MEDRPGRAHHSPRAVGSGVVVEVECDDERMALAGVPRRAVRRHRVHDRSSKRLKPRLRGLARGAIGDLSGAGFEVAQEPAWLQSVAQWVNV